MTIDLTAHSTMIGDAVRSRAFQVAVHAAVTPGDVVVDVGAGTGLLAYFACQAGARRVYAIEREPRLVALGQAIAAANGWQDVVRFIAGESMAVDLPERADVVVSETIGHFGVDEGALQAIADARTRWLKPGGRVVPSRLAMFLAPADSFEGGAVVSFWDKDVFGVDLSAVRRPAASARHVLDVAAGELMAAPQQVSSIEFGTLTSPPTDWSAELRFAVARAGVVNGFAGWFELDLAPGVRISTAPGEPRTHWQQAFFPLAEPLDVVEGDTLTLVIAALVPPGGPIWSWRGALERGGRIETTFDLTSFEDVSWRSARSDAEGP